MGARSREAAVLATGRQSVAGSAGTGQLGGGLGLWEGGRAEGSPLGASPGHSQGLCPLNPSPASCACGSPTCCRHQHPPHPLALNVDGNKWLLPSSEVSEPVCMCQWQHHTELWAQSWGLGKRRWAAGRRPWNKALSSGTTESCPALSLPLLLTLTRDGGTDE